MNDQPGLPADSGAKHFVYAFILAVVLYLAFFFGCEHFRQRHGPWQITFGAETNQIPFIEISQAAFHLDRVRLVFTGHQVPAVAPPRVLTFATPATQTLPFGQVKFLDTTFLPGTVTLDLFGHEVELLPRVLIIDKQEHHWRSGSTLTVPAAQNR